MPEWSRVGIHRRFVMQSAALLVVLAACSGGDSSDRDGGTLSGSITVAAAGSEGEIAALEAVAEAFMAENEGTTVELDTVESTGDFIAALTTAFAASSPPDVFVLNYRRLGRFAAADEIAEVGEVDTSGLFQEPLEAFTFDGQLLCLPSNASSMVVYYNPDLFEQAGEDVPQEGWTWDDLLQIARDLRTKGVKAIGFDTALIRLAPFVWSNGGDLVDSPDAPTAVDLDSPEARESLQLLLDLQETGLSATDREAQEPEESFLAGEIAMYLDTRRAVPGMRGTEGLTFDVVGVPAKESAVSVLHSDGYCVTAEAENPAVAHAFTEFAVLGEGATILAESGRTVPMLRSVAESDAFLDPSESPASSRVWLDQLGDARALPHSPTWNEAEELCDEVLTQLFAGNLTVDQAIEEIREGTERILAGP